MSDVSEVVVALDVGGTGIKCALVGPDGTVHHSERHPTERERGWEAVLETILDVAAGLATRARSLGHTPVAVGIVVPGIVDEAAGVAAWSANLGFRDVPIKKLMAARVGLPAALGHDVRAGGLAEARLGAGRGHTNVLFVAIGTGIAAAIIMDGAPFSGAHGAAGEIGHIVVRPGGPRCGCGQRGCMEIMGSAAAVGRQYRERTGRPATAEEVATRAHAGDPDAAAVWHDAVAALADGLLIGMALFDPAVIVVGGGLAEASDGLLAPLRSAIHERVTFHREPALVRAALGDEAGCIGAALIAIDAKNSREDNA
jgi:glucokinase